MENFVFLLLLCVLTCSCDGEPDGQRVEVFNRTSSDIFVEYDGVQTGHDGERVLVRDVSKRIAPGDSIRIKVHMVFALWTIRVHYLEQEELYSGSLRLGTDTVHVDEIDFLDAPSGAG